MESSAAAMRRHFRGPGSSSGVRPCAFRWKRSRTPKGARPSSEPVLPLPDYLARPGDAIGCLQCLSFDPATRASRWLLHVQDRAGDRIALTQEALAGLLGVQRRRSTPSIHRSQDEGLVEAAAGRCGVIDRVGLKRRACECYQPARRHFGAVIGASGRGGESYPASAQSQGFSGMKRNDALDASGTRTVERLRVTVLFVDRKSVEARTVERCESLELLECSSASNTVA